MKRPTLREFVAEQLNSQPRSSHGLGGWLVEEVRWNLRSFFAPLVFAGKTLRWAAHKATGADRRPGAGAVPRQSTTTTPKQP